MPKVQLEVIDNKHGLIKAPDFCPYKAIYNTDTFHQDPLYSVNASICPLCKICEFEHISANIGISNEFTKEDRAKITQNMQENQAFLNSALRQISYLKENDRLPIAIFINFAFLQEIIELSLPQSKHNPAISILTETDGPLCLISGIPVYFNRKLTKSTVQVVGEVEWS